MRKRAAQPTPSPESCWQVYYGPNEEARRRALALALDDMLPQADREFALDRMEGPTATAGAVIVSAQTLPFLAPRRVVLVTDAQAMPRGEQTALAGMLDKVSPPARVVLEITRESERKAPLEQTLWRALGKCAALHEFPHLAPQEAQDWVVRRAHEAGVTLDNAAAVALVQRLGTDTAALANELDKLALSLEPGGRITRQVVLDLSPRQPEDDIFALTDAIGERRTGPALRLLSDLVRFHREPPPRVLFMVARQLRQIWQAKALAEAGWRPGAAVPEQATALLPDPAAATRMPSWLYGRLRQQATRFTWDHLQAALVRVLQCDLAIKDIEGGVADPVLALELMVCDLCRPVAPPEAGSWRSASTRW